MDLSDEQFDELLDEAWNQIPQDFKAQIDNTVVVIESEPTGEQLRRMKIRGLLLGLFQGVPKTAWGRDASGVIPNKITIFRKTILLVSKDMKDLKITIHVVLMHEIAHYFGYNDDDMFIMDKKMRARLLKDYDSDKNF
ncbi:metallopeptidase family protein [bacterium]|nr:metallopeptidase family protein [bacterium]